MIELILAVLAIGALVALLFAALMWKWVIQTFLDVFATLRISRQARRNRRGR